MTRRFRVLLSILIVSLVCICGLSTFLANYSVGFYAADRFTAAYDRWVANDIQDYEAIVQVAIPLSDFWQYRVVVQDGEVQEVGRKATFAPTAGFLAEVSPESFTPFAIDEGVTYTIDGLMSYARSVIATAPAIELRACDGTTYWDAEYDTQYSYIRSLRFSCGGGFLGCNISECTGGYTVLSFTPLAP